MKIYLYEGDVLTRDFNIADFNLTDEELPSDVKFSFGIEYTKNTLYLLPNVEYSDGLITIGLKEVTFTGHTGKFVYALKISSESVEKYNFTIVQETIDVKRSIMCTGTSFAPENSLMSLSEFKTEAYNALEESTSAVNLRIDGKVDKVDGKGLSANDYTNAEKNKLSSIEESANNYSLPVDVVRDSTYVKTDKNFTNAKSDKLDRINTSWKLTVPTTGWTNNTNYFSITIVANGMLPTDIPIIDIDLNGTESDYDALMRSYENIRGAATGTDTITLNFSLVPTTPFDVKVVI